MQKNPLKRRGKKSEVTCRPVVVDLAYCDNIQLLNDWQNNLVFLNHIPAKSIIKW
jgi:hypothetical protein